MIVKDSLDDGDKVLPQQPQPLPVALQQQQQQRFVSPLLLFTNHPVHQAMTFASDSKDYFRAVALCPHVVHTESPHDVFLKFELDNVWSASQRLANYWTLRVEFYGESAAFLPLHLALTEQDVKNFEQGAPIPVPVPPLNDGRCVNYWDRSKICKNQHSYDHGSSKRCGFFVHQQVMMQSYSKLRQEPPFKQGDFVLLMKFDNNRLIPTFLDSSLGRYARKRSTAMCTRSTEAHFLVVNPPKEANFQFLFKMFTTTLYRVAISFANKPTFLHIGSPEKIVQELMDCGMNRHGIPSDLGGTWNYDLEVRDLLRRTKLLGRGNREEAIKMYQQQRIQPPVNSSCLPPNDLLPVAPPLPEAEKLLSDSNLEPIPVKFPISDPWTTSTDDSFDDDNLLLEPLPAFEEPPGEHELVKMTWDIDAADERRRNVAEVLQLDDHTPITTCHRNLRTTTTAAAAEDLPHKCNLDAWPGVGDPPGLRPVAFPGGVPALLLEDACGATSQELSRVVQASIAPKLVTKPKKVEAARRCRQQKQPRERIKAQRQTKLRMERPQAGVQAC